MTVHDGNEFDVAVVGGGLVGMPVAWSLARAGQKVVVLDEGDAAYRPSRGNFALVWVQGKGYGMPRYAAWTMASAALWPLLATLLREETGLDICYRKPGGLMIALSEQELSSLDAQLGRLMRQPGMEPYAHDVIDRTRLERMLPGIGPEVAGATYTGLDGHVNSLRLFRALHLAAHKSGVVYRPSSRVEAIEGRAGGFRLRLADAQIAAGKVVLAAGHANLRLAPMVGLHAPVRPQRGQIIVTERVAPFLDFPLSQLRQTDEGTVMIGDSLEETGFDANVGAGVLGVMASRAVRTFPFLAVLNVVRSWAALRVMTPDGFPIYEQSASMPGAFLLTCHSGVTLAAGHAFTVPSAILAGTLPPDMSVFPRGGSMFRRLHETAPRLVSFILDGRPAEAVAGDSVAAALLANGITQFRRSPVSAAARGPYCMMGACFECLVTVDGVANRQGCLVEIEPGMRVETNKGRREVA